MPHVYLDNRSRPPVFRFQYWDHTGRRRSGTGTASRRETMQMAQRRQAFENEIKAGVRATPSPIKDTTPFDEVLTNYLDWGNTQGGRGGRPWSEHHARMRKTRLTWWKKKLNLATMHNMSHCLVRVEQHLRQLKLKGATGKTCMQYVEALRAFCAWAMQRKYLAKDPLDGLASFDTTPTKIRRAMTPQEIERFLSNCRAHKRTLYEIALATGLRAGELRSLQVGDLDKTRGGLILRSRWTKNRKDGFQPMPAWLVKKMAKEVEGRAADEPMLEVPRDPIHAFLIDLKRAGIARETPEGKLDFHALRVAYITLVVESGADLKTAQTLARHSTPNLTMVTYARARQDHLERVAESVGAIVKV